VYKPKSFRQDSFQTQICQNGRLPRNLMSEIGQKHIESAKGFRKLSDYLLLIEGKANTKTKALWFQLKIEPKLRKKITLMDPSEEHTKLEIIQLSFYARSLEPYILIVAAD